MIGEAREGEERGRGTPLTDEEREERHVEEYGTNELPPRGTGLGQGSDGTLPVQKAFWRQDNIWAWIAGLGGGFLILQLLRGAAEEDEEEYYPTKSDIRAKGSKAKSKVKANPKGKKGVYNG